MQVAQTIKALLDARGVSPAKMSKDLGFSSGSFTQWKNGRSNISTEALDKIATYLQVSTDYLLGRTDNPAPLTADAPHVSPAELELLERYRRLSPEKQRAIDALLK